MRRLQPGRIVRQDDGSLLAPDFGDTYASRAGALAQSRAVFLAGCDLPQRLSGRSHTVLETGFGTGLNALTLAQLQAGASGAATACHIHYVGIEARPLLRDDLVAALAPYEEFAAWRDALLASWPPPMQGFYRIVLSQRFTVTLVFDEVLAALQALECRADSVFLDGFAPDRNPAMWRPEVLAEVVAHCQPGARLASWCVAGEVRRALAAAGCTVERKPGFAAKRERLEAVAPARFEAESDRPYALSRSRAEPLPDRALVIGAGIAGASAAAALAARGIAVTVVDTAGPASGASGNPVGVVRPEPSGLDHPISALTAMGTVCLRPWLAAPCGAVRLPRDDKHARRLREHADACPPEWMRWVSADEAATLTGQVVAGDGVWIAHSWSVNPPELVAKMLATPGVTLLQGAVRQLTPEPSPEHAWRVTLSDGSSSVWPLVVVANAFGVGGHLRLPTRQVRGQLSWTDAQSDQGLSAIVCREGYVTPAVNGRHIIGATFQRDDADLAPRDADDATNQWRLGRLLPAWSGRSLTTARVSVRAATPDRLPLVGELAPGVFASLGHGSRGLTCAPLCAELIASWVCGEPLPLSRDVVHRLDPLRFGEIEVHAKLGGGSDD